MAPYSESLRESLMKAITSHEHLKNQYQKNLKEANLRRTRVQNALKKGNKQLANEALTQQKIHEKNAAELEAHIQRETPNIERLRQKYDDMKQRDSLSVFERFTTQNPNKPFANITFNEI